MKTKYDDFLQELKEDQKEMIGRILDAMRENPDEPRYTPLLVAIARGRNVEDRRKYDTAAGSDDDHTPPSGDRRTIDRRCDNFRARLAGGEQVRSGVDLSRYFKVGSYPDCIKPMVPQD